MLANMGKIEVVFIGPDRFSPRRPPPRNRSFDKREVSSHEVSVFRAFSSVPESADPSVEISLTLVGSSHGRIETPFKHNFRS